MRIDNPSITGSATITGSLSVVGPITSTGTITAQTLTVQTVTSSIIYSSGSNVFGNLTSNVQSFTGSLRVTGSGDHHIIGGNVGIDTTTPANKLDVSGSIGVNTSGQTRTISTFYGAGSDGANIFIGGGGLSSGTGGDSSANGSYNIAVGVEALLNNTTGYGNTAVGVEALFNNTTGHLNVANGYQALYSNTTGYLNVANGYLALYSNTTGNNNTANGYQALYSNTTGFNNTANGPFALSNNATGNNNTANGFSGLRSNTTGIGNTSVGVNSLRFNTTGNNNIALGVDSGRFIADGSANTITNNSIFIGNEIRVAADNQTNQIVIGYQETGLGSNTTIIGNSSTVTTALRGRLLLGTTTDNGTDRLQVSGSANITGNLTVDTNTLFVDATNNRVGIGTASPASLLHVYTTTSSDTEGYIKYENANTGTGAATNAQLIGKSKYGTAQFLVWENLGVRLGMRSTANGGVGDIYFTTGTDSVKMFISSSGNVGIGTTTPSTALEVNGTITETSSKRYKENIVTISSALDKVTQMRGVTYTRKENGLKEVGVIAEEVNEIFPDLVNKNQDGIVESVSYGRFTALLIEAVKEQQSQIEELKQEINSLKNK